MEFLDRSAKIGSNTYVNAVLSQDNSLSPEYIYFDTANSTWLLAGNTSGGTPDADILNLFF